MNKKSVLCSFYSMLLIQFNCITSKGMISVYDNNYFSDTPGIIICHDQYYLKFRYSNDEGLHFFMITNSKIENNKLIFYISATSSSGEMTGKTQYEEIIQNDKISLINRSLVFWEEPDGKLVSIRVVKNGNCDIQNYLKNVH
jgi:hypothetical protein